MSSTPSLSGLPLPIHRKQTFIFRSSRIVNEKLVNSKIIKDSRPVVAPPPPPKKNITPWIPPYGAVHNLGCSKNMFLPGGSRLPPRPRSLPPPLLGSWWVKYIVSIIIHVTGTFAGGIVKILFLIQRQ